MKFMNNDFDVIDREKVRRVIDDNLNHEYEPFGSDCSCHNHKKGGFNDLLFDDRCSKCRIEKGLGL